jgi:hypothetical protein
VQSILFCNLESKCWHYLKRKNIMHGVYASELCNLFSFAIWNRFDVIISKEIMLWVAYMTPNCAIYSLLQLGIKVLTLILIYNSMKFKLKSYTATYDSELCNLFSFATWSQSADIISKERILCVVYMPTNYVIYSLLRLGVKVLTLF